MVQIEEGSRVTSSLSSLERFYFLTWTMLQFSSVQFSHSVVSDSLRPHKLQHTRPPCPSPTPGVHSNSWPSSWWCHPAISSSFVPFSSCPQSLPESESFPVSQLFAWGGQSTGVSASASFPPKISQGWCAERQIWGPQTQGGQTIPNIRVWNRERFTKGQARRWVVLTLKTPNSLKAFGKVLF